ncbi:uncharacterized protein ACO6RY_06299 [Pungitius sinensis]
MHAEGEAAWVRIIRMQRDILHLQTCTAEAGIAGFASTCRLFLNKTTALNLAAVRQNSQIRPPQYSAAVCGKVHPAAHKRGGDG